MQHQDSKNHLGQAREETFSTLPSTPSLRSKKGKKSSGATLRGKPQTTRIQVNTTQRPAAKLPIEFRADSIRPGYESQTLRPIVSLAFVFPLILLYELCVIFWGRQELRSGIDQWLDRFLATLGVGQLVVLPLLTAAVLIIWHHRKHDLWQIRGTVLGGMLVESIVLGLILFCAANACNQIAASTTTTTVLSISASMVEPHWWAQTIASLGSGIYEELVFRLMLLLPAIQLWRKVVGTNRLAILGGVILVSLIFSCLHYNVINPAGAAFQTGSFVFRVAASIVFCILFLFRGFGIAVGTHVAYDILTQI